MFQIFILQIASANQELSELGDEIPLSYSDRIRFTNNLVKKVCKEFDRYKRVKKNITKAINLNNLY